MDDTGATLDAQPGANVSADWLTLQVAAEQLGISLDAMRRRMRRGEYPRRQIRTRHGMTWQVRLEPIDAGTTLAPTVAPIVDVDATVQALLTYLRERDQQRDREVADLRAELAQARADLVDHAAQLAEACEQLRALQAPNEPTTSEIAPQSSPDVVSVDTAQQSPRAERPWWRFWAARPA